MAAELRWDDAEDIGIALSDKFPEVNPLEVRFTDLHRYVTELPTFVDDAKTSNEGKLQAIWMASSLPSTRRPPTKANSKPSRWPGSRNRRIKPDELLFGPALPKL